MDIKRVATLNEYYESNINYLEECDGKYKLMKDLIVNSPSFASCLAKGRYATNGWTSWKNINNETLDEVYRNTKTIE